MLAADPFQTFRLDPDLGHGEKDPDLGPVRKIVRAGGALHRWVADDRHPEGAKRPKDLLGCARITLGQDPSRSLGMTAGVLLGMTAGCRSGRLRGYRLG